MMNFQSENPFAIRTQELINSKKYSEAESLIKTEETQNPNNPDIYYFRGVSSYFQGKFLPTIENLKKALELDPKHTDAAICLSVLYNDVGKYEEGKASFQLANQSVVHKNFNADADINRKFAIKHLEIADLYLRYRRYDEAIEEYTKAISLDSTDLEIRIRRSKAFAKKGFVTRAMQELQQLKQEHPHYIPARIQLGLLHFSQGNLLDAELDWESVLSIQPGNKEAISYLEMAKKNRSSI